MRVLVGFEESGVVSGKFTELGHDAWSCDLKPTRGTNPRKHLQQCIKTTLENEGEWDLVILHPDCTALAVSGNAFYGEYKKWNWKRQAAIKWTKEIVSLAKTKTSRLCVENPRSVIFEYLGLPTQNIQPWMFGHLENKFTTLGLKGLPNLVPTNDVSAELAEQPRIVRERIRRMGGGTTRKRDRSVTYEGIALAMAEQWGGL